MPKLIDADKLKAHYAWWDNEDKKIFDTIIDLQPEAVVRCKDCKYYSGDGYDECELMSAKSIIASIKDKRWYSDFYCAWGERKEDGNKPKSI